MGPLETFGYYLITFTAGHDTTKNALAGGMNALIENPAERERLRKNPEKMVAGAVEEIVRWATPVNYMKRTVAHDVEFRGKQLKKGDECVLFYASGNRDEEIFDEPFRFRIDRDPNRHVGFGHGEHFCLGAHLARLEGRIFFEEVLSTFSEIELTGEPVRVRSNLNAGYKRMPMRLTA
jgi:cytochrome P450